MMTYISLIATRNTSDMIRSTFTIVSKAIAVIESTAKKKYLIAYE